MRKILLRTLLLCTMLLVLLIPAVASAKTANATATPTISGANYSTTVKIHLADIPDDGTAKASEAAKFSSGYVSISSTGYSDYLRVKFTPKNGAKDGTVTQIDINLLHVCKYDYTQIPAATTEATCTEDATKTSTCIYCKGTTTEVTKKATGHAFTKKLVDTKYLQSAATCTEDAVYFYSCCYCGEAGTETFKDTGTALGHDWGEYITTTASTCIEAGVKTRTCSVCKAQETAKISATGHQYSDYVSDNNATCTKDGTKTATCDSCGQAKETVKVDGTAIGHRWNKGEVTTAPTVDHKGEMTYTCQNCQATKTETLAKLEPEKPTPATPTPGTTDPTTPTDPSEDKPAAGDQKQTLTASTDAARNLEKQTETPRTSDDSALMLWTVLLLLSGVSLTSAGIIRRRR